MLITLQLTSKRLRWISISTPFDVNLENIVAQLAYELMTEIGFNNEGKHRMVEFNLQRPIEGSPKPQGIKVQAPFFGLVPLPNLLIDNVQVNFQMEVTATEISTEKEDKE